MTQAVIPVLARMGVKAVSVGVNNAAMPPDVPPIFRWENTEGNASLIALWHPGGYAQLGGSVCDPDCSKLYYTVPGSSEALVMSWDSDNQGPPGCRTQALLGASPTPCLGLNRTRPTPPCPANWWEGQGVCFQGCPNSSSKRDPISQRCYCDAANPCLSGLTCSVINGKAMKQCVNCGATPTPGAHCDTSSGVAAVKATWAQTQRIFPNATVVASSLDKFIASAAPFVHALPVIKGEIADNWVIIQCPHMAYNVNNIILYLLSRFTAVLTSRDIT